MKKWESREKNKEEEEMWNNKKKKRRRKRKKEMEENEEVRIYIIFHSKIAYGPRVTQGIIFLN